MMTAEMRVAILKQVGNEPTLVGLSQVFAPLCVEMALLSPLKSEMMETKTQEMAVMLLE